MSPSRRREILTQPLKEGGPLPKAGTLRGTAEGVVRAETAMGVASAVGEGLPEDGNGLGKLGEQTLVSLLDEARAEQAEKRLPYLFTKYARDFFDLMHPERWDALRDRIDADMERKALWRLWKRVVLAAVPVGGGVYVWASGLLDKWWPLLKRFLELLKATPT